MKRLIFLVPLLVCMSALCQVQVTVSIPALGINNAAATINGLGTKISQYPNAPIIKTNYLLVVAAPLEHTNYSISIGELGAVLIATSTNGVVIQTNLIAYSTNFYINNTTVSNYFFTNLFSNTAISNYFNTNQFFFTTNLVTTNTYITNFLQYATTVVSNLTLQEISTNSFVSNYFQTNIFLSQQFITTNASDLWGYDPTTGYITNVNGGGVRIGGTNQSSQIYLYDGTGSILEGGFDTNTHAGFWGPGLAWTNYSNINFPLNNSTLLPAYPGVVLFATNSNPLLIYDSTLATPSYSQFSANSFGIGNDAADPTRGDGLDHYSYFPNPAVNVRASVLALQADSTGYGSGVLLDPNADNAGYPFSFSTTSTNTIGSTSNLFVIQNSHVNKMTLKGNGVLGVFDFISPTNTPAVSQILQSSSTGGDSKWADVNQVISNVTFTILQSTTNIFNIAKGGTLILSNGLVPGFILTNPPSSQGTNWILDGNVATYFTIKATNDIYIQRITNTISTLNSEIGGAAISLRVLPNGANRTFSMNSNYVVLQTNIWTLNTALSPGVYQTTITNSVNLNGPRALLISFVCFDSTFNPTNVVCNAILSP